jgi:hypothetical protein
MFRRLFIVAAALMALTIVPFLTTAQPATSVNIVNNSSREIRSVYLSSVNGNDWSSNQLGGSVIAPGQSFTLNNVACNQTQVKVIAEDQEGCFLSQVITCGESSTWTITNDTTRNCGGGGK